MSRWWGCRCEPGAPGQAECERSSNGQGARIPGRRPSQLGEGRHKTAVNRSYYAALAAIRSLLILEGADPETHDGVITPLSLRFVKPGLLSVPFVKSFKLLQSRRADVDYGDLDTIGKDDAEDAVRTAEEMIHQAEVVRTSLWPSSTPGHGPIPRRSRTPDPLPSGDILHRSRLSI